MKVKTLFTIFKSNFTNNDKWVGEWENNADFLKAMQVPIENNLDAVYLALNLINKKSKVLSAGCGPGREVKFLVRNLKCSVTAVDRSERMIKLSKEFEPDAEYKVADFVSFRTAEKFDYVTCLWNTINYLPNRESRRRFVESAYFNLKKGGSLIITSGNRSSNWKTFVRSVLEFNKDFYYNPNQIRRWFEGTGFRVRKVVIGDDVLIVANKQG